MGPPKFAEPFTLENSIHLERNDVEELCFFFSGSWLGQDLKFFLGIQKNVRKFYSPQREDFQACRKGTARETHAQRNTRTRSYANTYHENWQCVFVYGWFIATSADPPDGGLVGESWKCPLVGKMWYFTQIDLKIILYQVLVAWWRKNKCGKKIKKESNVQSTNCVKLSPHASGICQPLNLLFVSI